MTTPLDSRLRALLEEFPDGIPEHRLLKRLQTDEPEAFAADLFRDDLALFRAHFLLFHALYGLRDALVAEGAGWLQIEPGEIRLLPLLSGSDQALGTHDPMRAYYGDLANLTDTTAEDVASLLGAFWTRYLAFNQREEALAVLGLPPTAGLDEAQRRYRELAMAHHPDRGGERERFEAIEQAIRLLRRG